MAVFCESHLQPFPELPSDGPPMAAGREADPKRPGRRNVEKEMTKQGWTWGDFEKVCGRQTTVASCGGGFVRLTARRGLSK